MSEKIKKVRDMSVAVAVLFKEGFTIGDIATLLNTDAVEDLLRDYLKRENIFATQTHDT